MFSNPIKNLKALPLREDNIVADLGAGTGFYSVAAGKLVPKGKVYAVELQKDYLTTIKSRIYDLGLKNVEIVWGNVEKLGGTKIADNTVDVVIASNILFQVEDKDKFIDEIKRILKHGGRVLLVDWSETSIMGKTEIVLEDKALNLFEKKAFRLERNVDAGEHHYGMILSKV